MKNLITLLGFMVLFVSCNDDNMIYESLSEGHNGVMMSAPDFIASDPTTRVSLTPSLGGTTFSWDNDDVVAVYSSQRGLTNFFIDANSISEDKASAMFYGSGFSLNPQSTYYAFYPYSLNLSLDKTKIPVRYNYQTQNTNGDFKNLGNFDFMSSKGVTDETGGVGFSFEHLGCVVEYTLKVPQTAYYTKVRLEAEPTSDVHIVKSGSVDITSDNVNIENNEDISQDSILSVHLNGEEGLYVCKDSTLTVYMMMAPQDLSGTRMIIRLVDSESNWYSAYVNGKNMKAGHTYHYVITGNGEGGFNGSGTGLPDDEELVVEYKSMLSTYGNVNDIVSDNTFVYIAEGNGVSKIDIDNLAASSVVATNKLDTKMKYLMARGIAETDDYLYVSMRQPTGGMTESIKPKVRLNFESNIKNFTSTPILSNNTQVNNFFEYVNIKSVDPAVFNRIYLYKAFKKSDGVYRNSILLGNGDGVSLYFVGDSYATQEEALSNLSSIYRTSKGDICRVNWDAIPTGGQYINPLILNNEAAKGDGLMNSETCNLFFRELRISTVDPSIFNRVYIYKAYAINGSFKNSITFSDGNGHTITFLSKSYKSEQEALKDLKNEYSSIYGDYCNVDWSCVPTGNSSVSNLRIRALGTFNVFHSNQYADIQETGSPCPAIGLHSAILSTTDVLKEKAEAVLEYKLINKTQNAEISFWLKNIGNISEQVSIPLLKDEVDNELCLVISPKNDNYTLGISMDGHTTLGNAAFCKTDWYNIKMTVHGDAVSLYWREKECGEWQQLLKTSQVNKNIQALLLGIKTYSGNCKIMIDEYYYNPTDIDNVSYINGQMVVLRKADMEVVDKLNLELKGTDIFVRDNYVFMNCLKGFNVYNIENRSNPKLVFTHRDNIYTEYQGSDFYTQNGRNYMVTSNYNLGLSIWDITEPEKTYKVAHKSFEGLVLDDGTILNGTGYGFDVKVDYPYVYATWANNSQYVNTTLWHIGLITYNISNLSDITMKFNEIPISDRYTITTDGDKRPTRIAKYGNHLILNNSNKGVVIFNNTDKSSPTYEGQIDIPSCQTINPVFVSEDGKMILGDNGLHLLQILR